METHKKFMIYSNVDGVTYYFHGFNTPVTGSKFMRPTFLSGFVHWGKNVYPRQYKSLKTAKKIAAKCASWMGDRGMYHGKRIIYVVECTFDESGDLIYSEKVDW